MPRAGGWWGTRAPHHVVESTPLWTRHAPYSRVPRVWHRSGGPDSASVLPGILTPPALPLKL